MFVLDMFGHGFLLREGEIAVITRPVLIRYYFGGYLGHGGFETVVRGVLGSVQDPGAKGFGGRLGGTR